MDDSGAMGESAVKPSEGSHQNQELSKNDHSAIDVMKTDKLEESKTECGKVHSDEPLSISLGSGDKEPISSNCNSGSGCEKQIGNHVTTEEPLDKQLRDSQGNEPRGMQTTAENTETTSSERKQEPTSEPSSNSVEKDEVLQKADANNSAKPKLEELKREKENSASEYKVKWITFRGEDVGIITQNENGPCPLLALMNILLLKRSIKLPGGTSAVTCSGLLDYLAECIFQSIPKNLSNEDQLNYHQNVNDAFQMFPKLQTGLDVNVRFTGVSDFEYTSESIIFDLLGVKLYHGWLADPQNKEEMEAVGSYTYNQLVEQIIADDRDDPTKQKVLQSGMPWFLVAEEFLKKNSHQLTYHGLCELVSALHSGELCVFFRNNHFSTLLKHQSELFLLVTDQGFLQEPRVCWETLSNVEGDSYFVDCDYKTYIKPEPAAATASFIASGDAPISEQQIQNDYLIALSLQEESNQSSQLEQSVPGSQLTDYELALKLQEEDELEAAHQQRAHQQQQSNAHTPQQAQQQACAGPSSDATPSRQSRQQGKHKECSIL